MSIRIVQLTDCHLMVDPLAELKGVRTRETFARVLAMVNERFPDAERLIITGDLTHDEQLATYQILRASLGEWVTKLRVIPGNHDDRALMRTVFGERIQTVNQRNVFVDDVGNWRLIGLDSQIPGEVAGELGPNQLAWLESQLLSAGEREVCLFLHHPPVVVQSAWLDRIGLQDAESFLRLIQRFPKVRLVVCGHIHQELTARVGETLVVTTPSTGVQFRPETESLEVDTLAPGFRVLDLADDGAIRTRVERV